MKKSGRKPAQSRNRKSQGKAIRLAGFVPTSCVAALHFHKATVATELGEDLATSMARRSIPGERFRLQRIAQSLAVVPAAGCISNPVREALKAELEADPRLCREAVQLFLSKHLTWLLDVSLGGFRAAAKLGRGVPEGIRLLTETHPNSASADRLLRMYRLARRDRDLMAAVRNFFLCELPIDALRGSPGLVAKLMPTLTEDARFLGDFLFQGAPRSKRSLGLIPQALVNDAAGSPFRRKIVHSQTWPAQLRLHEEGRKESEITLMVERRAGSQLKSAKQIDSRSRFRQRMGLVYPKVRRRRSSAQQ